MLSETPKLCISLLPKSHQHLKEWIPQSQQADLIEVRIDHLPEIDFEELRSLSSKPLIVTLRSAAEGGFWKGDESEQLTIYQRAADAGIAYIDIEFAGAKHLLPRLKLRTSTQIILSHHTEEKSLEKLIGLLHHMSRTEASIYKLVFSAESLPDNITALKLTEEAKAQQLNFIIHTMGENSQLSRLLGAIQGNAWTYVAPDLKRATANGQLSFLEAKNYYALPKKSAHTKVLGLVGSPLQQSKGWRLHNRLIEKMIADSPESHPANDDFIYVNFAVEHFNEFWVDWHERLHGLSVTLPFKEKVIEYLSRVSPGVKISGVCNTMVREGDKWKGYNTDLYALETLLRPYEEALKKGGLIIGTGATARSAIAALKRLEISPIFIVGRNEQRGKMLSEIFGVEYLKESEVHYAGVSGIIQSTPVGMVPYTDQYPVGTSHFRRERIVLDVIYNPAETRFLKIARERGCVTISGIEMFLSQAAKQFELFTGIPVSTEIIHQVWEEVR